MSNRLALTGVLIVGGLLAAGFMRGLVAETTPAPATALIPAPISAPTPSAPTDSKPTNPLVEPGKVHWHATTEAALAAARASHKPVLVFHMMGRLDHQFC